MRRRPLSWDSKLPHPNRYESIYEKGIDKMKTLTMVALGCLMLIVAPCAKADGCDDIDTRAADSRKGARRQARSPAGTCSVPHEAGTSAIAAGGKLPPGCDGNGCASQHGVAGALVAIAAVLHCNAASVSRRLL